MTNTAGVMARALTVAQADAADAGLKGMISVGRPFLDYVVSALADAGVDEVILVIGPEHDVIRDYYQRVSPPARVRITFAVQDEPLGTAQAVVVASRVIGERPFLVLNADNYYPVVAVRELVAACGAATIAFDRDALVRDGNISAERVRSFAILDVAPDGTLSRIIEKPGAYLDLGDMRWVGMNCWNASPALVDACSRVPLSSRGEFELPEAVALALREGMTVRVTTVSAGVLDLSQRSDIASVMQRLAHVEAHP
jgi:dTDP-glucose pyrophosphorylase